jgi:hypothetical protein
MNTIDKKLLDRHLREYAKASARLVCLRDDLYPEGSKVSMFGRVEATIIRGSLYPDQVNTDKGHMGIRNIRLVPNKG